MSSPLGVPSLKEFVDAMGAAWPVAAAISVGSFGILGAERAGVSYVDGLPDPLKTAVFFLAVFSGAVCLIAILQTLFKGVASWRAKRNEKSLRHKQIAKLLDLPPDEHHIMSWLFSANKQAFPAELADRRLVGLRQKGLIVQEGGTNSILDWPHFVPDHVWEAMHSDSDSFTLDLRVHGNPLRNR